MSKGTIRFEDLGEPVQRLLNSMNGKYTDEDMALLEYVSVKDMARIYQEMSSERHAQEIWEELKAALETRKAKAERKNREMQDRAQVITDAQRQAEEEAAEEEAQRLAEEQAAEEKRKRKEERRRRKAEEAARAEEEAEAERIRLEEEAEAAAEEEERLAAEEEAKRRREEKRKRREEKARRLAEEQEALEEDTRRQKSESKRRRQNQKKDWDDWVAQHPLDFKPNEPVERDIEQVQVQRDIKAPPKASKELLSRTFTPKCPHCGAKFTKPPPEWECPMCYRRMRQKIKVWQPDEDAPNCMICKCSVGRFSRHHCRNCGRVTCGKCSEFKGNIPSLGFKEAVKICSECHRANANAAVEAPAQPV